ncbi:MAG: MFS transporter [Demequina sp.]|uniref:MFS transporter n=1 Tax=Demequina sp. TaxID=2050685 RepID=UPI003A88BFEC
MPSARFAPTTTPDARRVAQARLGVLALFALMGACMATFLSRVPTIRDLLGVSSGELALLIALGAIGSLIALLVTGWAAARFGTRALLVWSSVGWAVAIILVGLSTALSATWLFSVGYFLVTFSMAFTNVAINAEAATVERFMGRAIMSQFHGTFSLGVAISLGMGAALSHVGVNPVWHFLGAAVVITAVRLAIVPVSCLDGSAQPAAAAASLGGPFATAKAEYRERRVILIGLIVFAASMTEMTAAQWMALTIVDDFDRPEAMGDVIYWVFVVAMVTVRWFGAPIIARLGRVVSLRISAVLVVAGLLVFAFAPAFSWIPFGAVLWGMGAALGVPIAFTAAADDPTRAAARVAAVASFSTVAGLLVPQLIGFLGEVVPLRDALLVVAAASATSFALARAVRTEGTLFGSQRAARRRAERAALEADEAGAGGAGYIDDDDQGPSPSPSTPRTS